MVAVKYFLFGLAFIGAVIVGQLLGIFIAMIVGALIDFLRRGRVKRNAAAYRAAEMSRTRLATNEELEAHIGSHLSRDGMPAQSTPYNVHVPAALVRTPKKDAE